MIDIRERRIFIDGSPVLILAGEIHYFRVPRQQWQQRIDLLKEIGCNAVASYIPWLWHELPDGSIDVNGTSLPERDVAAFIDLCRDNGLLFIARPGPFIMAELKNEGIPYRVYREHPEIISTGWDGAARPTATVDYLAPAFLAESRRWYEAILPVIAERLQPRGGNVIGLQLDNEIGMLAWVSNSPDLTDALLSDFLAWCRLQHGDTFAQIYPTVAADGSGWRAAVESPDEQWAAVLRVDLGTFMRRRFAEYTRALSDMCAASGIQGIPLLINIHGTEGGNGVPLAIGISQLLETYSGVPGMVAGSDHYLGDMSLSTTTDIHFINAAMAAVNGPDQPLTSLEFEVGTGDYSGGLDQLYDPSTMDLKQRLSLAQGNRLINYYVIAGGVNPFLDEPVGDGNDRISHTGERHGTAAPIGPEGQRGLTFSALGQAVQSATLHARWLADMDEELDDLAAGFLPDAFMTEYKYPSSASMMEVVRDLEQTRGPGPHKALSRSLLFAGYRFSAVNLQDPAAALPTVVALASGRHLAAAVQHRLVDHLGSGGSLFHLGPLPELDLEGRECRHLVDFLGLQVGQTLRGSSSYFPSVTGVGWADTIPQMRVGWAQEVIGGDPVLRDGAGRTCGVEAHIPGGGQAVLLAAELSSMPAFFASVAEHLGASPGLRLDTSVGGVIATTTVSPTGDRLLHLLNPTGFAAEVQVSLDGVSIGDGEPFLVPARTGHLLALGLSMPWGRILNANAEILSLGKDDLVIGSGLGTVTKVTLETDLRVTCAEASEIEVRGRRHVVTAAGPGPLALRIG
jgi:beta-galactosidase